VVLEFATPTTTVKQQGALPPLSRSKWPERFGLFTMIVLGETVAEVIHALSGDPKIVEGILGLAIGFGLWWVYFDFIARRPSRQQISTALGWVYLHLLTLLAITVVGAAIAETIAGGEANERFLLLSVGGAGVAMGVLEMTLDREDGEPTHPYLSPALKIVLGAVLVVVSFVDLDPIPALTACLISLAVPAFYGARVWYRREQSTP
jgi:low temperature requirement protein LtrA